MHDWPVSSHDEMLKKLNCPGRLPYSAAPRADCKAVSFADSSALERQSALTAVGAASSASRRTTATRSIVRSTAFFVGKIKIKNSVKWLS